MPFSNTGERDYLAVQMPEARDLLAGGSEVGEQGLHN